MTSVSSLSKSTTADRIYIGGLTPFTTIDYPGQLATVLFLQGCPWRCDYCHNSSLIDRRGEYRYEWSAVLDFLRRRTGLIDAVVFSGGEPTLQAALEPAAEQIRQMGFKIGLHTAGIYPDRLKRLLPLLDWVGLDYKAPVSHYEEITGVPGSAERARRSARVVVESGIDYEVRTTLHPRLLEPGRVEALVDELVAIGVSNLSLQQCNLDYCTSTAFGKHSTPLSKMEDLARIEENFTKFNIRYSGSVM